MSSPSSNKAFILFQKNFSNNIYCEVNNKGNESFYNINENDKSIPNGLYSRLINKFFLSVFFSWFSPSLPSNGIFNPFLPINLQDRQIGKTVRHLFCSANIFSFWYLCCREVNGHLSELWQDSSSLVKAVPDKKLTSGVIAHKVIFLYNGLKFAFVKIYLRKRRDPPRLFPSKIKRQTKCKILFHEKSNSRNSPRIECANK